jgi:hypothetical protein
MADAQTITNNMPVMSITVPFYDSSYTYDVQTGKRIGSSGEIGTDASFGDRFTEENPPDPFAKAVARLYLRERDAIEPEKASPKVLAKFMEQYESNARALLEMGVAPVKLSEEEFNRLGSACIRLGFPKTNSWSVDQQRDVFDLMRLACDH